MSSLPADDHELSDALVLFGVTGDLAYKKLFPAAYEMVQDGRLDVPVVGVARSGWTDDEFRNRARNSIQERVDGYEPAVLDRLLALMHYVQGEYTGAGTYQRLGRVLEGCERPLHYLAIPPALFDDVVQGLATREHVVPERLDTTEGSYSVLVERREAIALAIGIARPEDTVVIAGKGHEDYQIVGREKLPFSDSDEARRALHRRAEP